MPYLVWVKVFNIAENRGRFCYVLIAMGRCFMILVLEVTYRLFWPQFLLIVLVFMVVIGFVDVVGRFFTLGVCWWFLGDAGLIWKFVGYLMEPFQLWVVALFMFCLLSIGYRNFTGALLKGCVWIGWLYLKVSFDVWTFGLLFNHIGSAPRLERMRSTRIWSSIVVWSKLKQRTMGIHMQSGMLRCRQPNPSKCIHPPGR